MARFGWPHFWFSLDADLRNTLRPRGTSAATRKQFRISEGPPSPLLRGPPAPAFSLLISEILSKRARPPRPLRTTNWLAAGKAHWRETHLSSRNFFRTNWEAGSLFNMAGRSSPIRWREPARRQLFGSRESTSASPKKPAPTLRR